MISLINIAKTYSSNKSPVTALENVSLEIQKGEIFGVIGASGAGKSTLLRCVNLLEKPDTGSVTVNSIRLDQCDRESLELSRRKIGMIFQHFNLLSTATVAENILLPLRIHSHVEINRNSKLDALLDLVGLRDKRNAYPSALSGGQKQRVAIARALINEPRILLCDEATSALDPSNTAAILELLKNINSKLNITILLITHEMNVIRQICDRVAVMDKGKIIEVQPTVDFFIRPHSIIGKHFAESLLSCELPQPLLHKLTSYPEESNHPVLRIYFQGEIASEPFIASLIQKFNIPVNILQARIEYFKDLGVGVMILQIHCEHDELSKVNDFLNAKGLTSELIGYLPYAN